MELNIEVKKMNKDRYLCPHTLKKTTKIKYINFFYIQNDVC